MFIYYVKIFTKNKVLYKIGVSNNVENRMRTLARLSLAKYIDLLHLEEFDTDEEAISYESLIKRSCADKTVKHERLPSTETFIEDILNKDGEPTIKRIIYLGRGMCKWV